MQGRASVIRGVSQNCLQGRAPRLVNIAKVREDKKRYHAQWSDAMSTNPFVMEFYSWQRMTTSPSLTPKHVLICGLGKPDPHVFIFQLSTFGWTATQRNVISPSARNRIDKQGPTLFFWYDVRWAGPKNCPANLTGFHPGLWVCIGRATALLLLAGRKRTWSPSMLPKMPKRVRSSGDEQCKFLRPIRRRRHVKRFVPKRPCEIQDTSPRSGYAHSPIHETCTTYMQIIPSISLPWWIWQENISPIITYFSAASLTIIMEANKNKTNLG